MTDPLGLSIGTTSLVGARVGNPPLTRRAVLTMYRGHPPQVGVPPAEADPDAITITGFVDRVGDPTPLVAPDGSEHHADRLLVEALTAITDDSGSPTSNITIARPAHWGSSALSALRNALLTEPMFMPGGVLVPVVSDATTALTALAVDPGLPDDGFVGLIDFGASGTSLTLADAGSAFTPVDETVRYFEFSGDHIDQLLLTYVLGGLASRNGIDPTSSTAVTAAVGAIGRLKDDCRDAKERLSSDSATEIDVELSIHRSRIRLTRSELDDLIADPLAGVITAFRALLQRNRIGPANLAALATVGGVANIPLITQRLADELGLPVVTTGRPELNAAAGAALLSARGSSPDAPTAARSVAAAVAAGSITAATGSITAATGSVATATDSIEAATGSMQNATDSLPTAAAYAQAPEEPASSAFRALAWSEEDPTDGEPVPYIRDDYDYPETRTTRSRVQFVPATSPPVDRTPRWYRRPMALVGLAAAVPLVAVGAFAYALTGNQSGTTSTPDTKPTTGVVPPASGGPPPPSQNFVAPSAVAPTSAAPPPPSPPPPPPVTHTVTTEVPAPVTTTQPVYTQATTTQPTTTQPTTTTPTTTTPPTTPTTTPTTTTSTTTTPLMTTSYINVPFVPVPIPIQVPATSSQAPYPYYPNNPYPNGGYPNGGYPNGGYPNGPFQ